MGCGESPCVSAISSLLYPQSGQSLTADGSQWAVLFKTGNTNYYHDHQELPLIIIAVENFWMYRSRLEGSMNYWEIFEGWSAGPCTLKKQFGRLGGWSLVIADFLWDGIVGCGGSGGIPWVFAISKVSRLTVTAWPEQTLQILGDLQPWLWGIQSILRCWFGKFHLCEWKITRTRSTGFKRVRRLILILRARSTNRPITIEVRNSFVFSFLPSIVRYTQFPNGSRGVQKAQKRSHRN